ncbi:hypothetical protein GCM10009530_65880 [Microbispora corallina]|uniref:Peptidase M15B domain-containing protein n=2 Tax=Microbispora corallina TaxID=83302 RepID=A0ABQ4G9J7_9ACTN|nr:hypothetical protein Mco01_67250 [Microbispora corallina]
MAAVVLVSLPMQHDPSGASTTPRPPSPAADAKAVTHPGARAGAQAASPAPPDAAPDSPAGASTGPATGDSPGSPGSPAGAGPGPSPYPVETGLPAPVEALAADLPPLDAVLAGTFPATVNAWDASQAGTRMDQPDALGLLRDAGVRVRSSGGCDDRRRPRCTSLATIRYGTVMRVVDLKRASGCDITITGGTETGHSGGRYSHGAGYKVDIAHNRCVDAYIRKTFPLWKVRGDGARLHRPTGDPDVPVGAEVYADEPTHWDILFP